MPKNTPDFQKERYNSPRFANLCSKEHKIGTRWKQLAELYKQKQEALIVEMKLVEEKLEAEMECCEYEEELEAVKRYEHETEILRKRNYNTIKKNFRK